MQYIIRYRYRVSIIAGLLVGLVFASSGSGKLLDQSDFLLSLSASAHFTPQFTEFIVTWLPWVELVLGIILIMGICVRPAAILCIFLCTAFIYRNVWMISHGMAFQPCSCLGIIDRIMYGRLSSLNALYVDAGLLILAGCLFFSYSGKFFNSKPWPLFKANGSSFTRKVSSDVPKLSG